MFKYDVNWKDVFGKEGNFGTYDELEEALDAAKRLMSFDWCVSAEIVDCEKAE